MHEYKVMAAVGVTPDSSLADVKNASFKFKARMTPEERQAWDTLRKPETRLAVDFLVVALQHPEAQ